MTTNIELTARLSALAAAHHHWRSTETVNLNAATNAISTRVRDALSSPSLADKGISSGLRSRHHRGGKYIDEIEEAVESLALDLFHAAAVDVRPPTGSLANAITIAAYADGDRPIMTSDGSSLGHLSYRAEGWGGRLASQVHPITFTINGIDIDIEATERDALRLRPAMFVVGSQTMLFPLDLAGLRRIADRIGAIIVYDAAHPLGLIAGGQFQDPLREGADIVTASTQKSLPGPVGGVILARDSELMTPIYESANNLLSNYQNNRVLALGYAFAEVAEFGATYAADCVSNAQEFAHALSGRGLEPLFGDRGYTQSNQILVPWGAKSSADEFAFRCEQADIIVSTVQIPGPSAPPIYGTRIGLQDVTRHGLRPDQLAELAGLLVAVAHGEPLDAIRRRSNEIAADTPSVYYCFESHLPAPNPGLSS